MRKWETAGLSMVRNHRIAASKGISEQSNVDKIFIYLFIVS